MTRIRWIALLGCLVVLGATGCAPGSSPPSPLQSPTPTGAAVLLPPSGARFSYQLGGPYPPAAGVGIVGRDRGAEAVAGMYSICYVNAFQVQPDELQWWQREHPDLLLRNDGQPVLDEEWGEPLVDTRHPERLMEAMGPWIDGCAQSGYQAVEADNLDSFTRSDGLLEAADNLRLGRLLADRAHANGLAIGQKNAAELARDARRAGFDFAIAEECQVYEECGEYTDVYGAGLLEVEYTDQPTSAFSAACKARGATVSVVRRDRDLVAAGSPGFVEQWC